MTDNHTINKILVICVEGGGVGGWTMFPLIFGTAGRIFKIFFNERCALLECHRQHFLLNFLFLNIDFGKKRLKNDHFRGFRPFFAINQKVIGRLRQFLVCR